MTSNRSASGPDRLPLRRHDSPGPRSPARRTCLAASLVLAAGVPLASGATGLTAPPSPTPVSDDAQAPPVSWVPCDPDDFPTLAVDGSSLVPDSYECATYQVPLDYDEPWGEAIDLALIRRPADDPRRRRGSLFFNPGGPGGSGVDFVALAGEVLFGAEVLASFDVIGFDPRGVARSTPLQCFDSNEAAADFVENQAFAGAVPETREEFRAARHDALALAAACERRAGPIIDHMGSANVARDLDVLRRAVGDAELNFVGLSYGTYLCAQYAAQYPGRTGALACDAAIDPVEYATGEPLGIGLLIPNIARQRREVGADATLAEFFRLCDEAGPERCAFAPNPSERYRSLLEGLERDPFELGELTIDEQNVLALSLVSIRDSGLGWEVLAGLLAELEGLVGGAPPEQEEELDPLPEDVITPPINVRYRNDVEALPGVVCSDNLRPIFFEAWVVATRRAHGVFGPILAASDLDCATWPGLDTDSFLGPFDRDTAHPVLIVNNRFDPATPYEDAVDFQSRLPSSALYTVEGWGHVASDNAACAGRAIDRYLLDRQAPRESGCVQDEVPFGGGAMLMAGGASDAPGGEPTPDAGGDRVDRQSWGVAMERAVQASMGSMMAGERAGESMRAAVLAAARSLRLSGEEAAADRLLARHARELVGVGR